MKKIRIWDLPLRLFHWTLAALIVVSIVTQNIGGNAMEWHFYSGYAVFALILFRILWGLIGSRYARFSSFIYGPASLVDYLRGGKLRKYLGHNPLGSLSVFALLIAVLVQAATGLFANDDIASEGPLVKFITKDLSDQITWIHKDVSAWAIYVLIALHILAITYYAIGKRQNLVKPMITGDQHVPFDAPEADDSWKMRLLAAVLLGLAGSVVYFIINAKP